MINQTGLVSDSEESVATHIEAYDESIDNLDYNILINARKLKEMIENNFICKYCMTEDRKRTPVTVEIITNGVASDVTCTCMRKLKKMYSPHMLC